MKFNEKLTKLRETHNLKQKNFSKLFSASEASVRSYENNRRVPNSHFLSRLSDMREVLKCIC